MSTDRLEADDLLSLVREQELAERWQKSRRTLQRWRVKGYGPPSVRIGSTVFYRVGDILAFERDARSKEAGQ